MVVDVVDGFLEDRIVVGVDGLGQAVADQVVGVGVCEGAVGEVGINRSAIDLSKSDELGPQSYRITIIRYYLSQFRYPTLFLTPSW